MPHMILTVVLIVICSYLFWLISVRRYRADTEGSVVSGDPVPEEKLYVLHKTENGERILFDGDSYFSWEGEFDEAAETWVWDWHGRMGQGLGFLAKEDALFPDGELFTLRGCKDILLAFLPSDGWPVTDMKLFLREGQTLPTVRADGFSCAEVFRIEGEFEEENYEKIADITDGEQIRSLATLWLEGENYFPPEGDYERYRVRLYSSEIPGLYVNVNVHVNRALQCYSVEKYRFSGDALLSVEEGIRWFG